MPNWISGKDGEKAWKKAKWIVSSEYGADVEKYDSDKFYALVTTVYKDICKSAGWDCGIAKKVEDVSVSGRIAKINERLARLVNIGDPSKRGKNAYNLGATVRNFAGELAYSMANHRDSLYKLVKENPHIKKMGKKAVDAMEDFANAIFDTEASIDVPFDVTTVKGKLKEGLLDEKSQPRLNKYDPGSLLGRVVHLLEKEGLDDAAGDVRKVSRSVSQAWGQKRT